jgi:hypothetical protein
VATKKGVGQQSFFHPSLVGQQGFFHPSLLLLFLDPGSEIQDPVSGMDKNKDPGSGTKITGSATQENIQFRVIGCRLRVWKYRRPLLPIRIWV